MSDRQKQRYLQVGGLYDLHILTTFEGEPRWGAAACPLIPGCKIGIPGGQLHGVIPVLHWQLTNSNNNVMSAKAQPLL